MPNKMANLLLDESGASLVEYSLLVGLIAAVCVAVVATFGTDVKTLFTNLMTTYP
jgi:pilus assembly protein Flp/PilA